MKILYSQCWEDPYILTRALEITPDDDILSIASGGDNTLALLLENPRSIIAVDRNPAQIYLVELKMAAIRYLDYERFIKFVGIYPEKNRWDIYCSLHRFLTPDAAGYWDKRKKIINRGIIHCGKLEKYLRAFNRYILPLIHNRNTVEKFLAGTNIVDQKKFYYHCWNNIRWRCLFGIFFSKSVLSRFGRSADFFQYVSEKDISRTLFNRTEYAFTAVPIKNNFYVEYILSGKYRNLEKTPPYLNPKNFEILKARINRIRLVCDNLDDFISMLPVHSISKFNLSDILEYMNTVQKTNLLEKIAKISRPGARLALWTLFIPQSIPETLKNRIKPVNELGGGLSSAALTFFYNSFCLWQTLKD